MTTEIATLTESGTEIFVPLNKLRKSPRNARKMPHSSASIEALAASIAVKGLLQNLVVEPERTEGGTETGHYLVTIGEGRRLAQLLRAKRKEIKKSEPIRCVLDTVNDAHEISLDENVTRENMHPADEYEAFKELAEERGLGAEEIGARFGVTAHVVRQRLKLGAVSPTLMALYRAGDMTLDQLMAFTLTDDHERQEQVWSALGWNKSRDAIRQALTHDQVRATDRRVKFVTLQAYEAAGGTVTRDLFDEHGNGYLPDTPLLDRLLRERLAGEAQAVSAEGWKWVEVVPEFDYQLAADMRRIYPQPVELNEEDAARLDQLEGEFESLSIQHDGEIPEEIAADFERLETEIEALRGREAFDREAVPRAGAFVSLGHDGALRVERGFIREEDEAAVIEDSADQNDEPGEGDGTGSASEEADLPAPLSEKLIAELSAHRTAALRDQLARQPELAMIALIHAVAIRTFHRAHDLGTCLEIEPKSVNLGAHAPGIDESVAGRAIAGRHDAWAKRLPPDPLDLWDFVLGLGPQDRSDLLAHCVSLTVDVLSLKWDRRPRRELNASVLADTLGLDMRLYWQPTPENYLSRVSKAKIAEAVTEGAGEAAAAQIDGHKKPDMVKAATELLTGRGWLPAMLRTRVSEEATQLPIAAE